MRILDRRFKYTPSVNTNVLETLKRHGFKPTTDAERKARQKKSQGPAKTVSADELTRRRLARQANAK